MLCTSNHSCVVKSVWTSCLHMLALSVFSNFDNTLVLPCVQTGNARPNQRSPCHVSVLEHCAVIPLLHQMCQIIEPNEDSHAVLAKVLHVYCRGFR